MRCWANVAEGCFGDNFASLTGGDLSDHAGVQRVLASFSRWNDKVQAAIFGANRLAANLPESKAMQDFRHNARCGPDKVPRLNPADYRLQLAGWIGNKRPWTIDELYALPQVSQVTRHVCVEGWSMIAKGGGTPLRSFECAGGYDEGIDMPTSPHPQTAMKLRLSDETLPTKHGYPFSGI